MFDEYPRGDLEDEPPDENARFAPRIAGVGIPPVPGRSHAGDVAFLAYIREGLAALDMSGTAKEQHEKITLVEQVKGAAAGAQVMSVTMMEADIVARRTEAGVRLSNPSFGVGAQVGLALRDSPDRGRSFLAFSNRLVDDLQFTLAALVAGSISLEQARLIDRETLTLPPEQRQDIDADLLRNPGALDGLCEREVQDRVRRLAYAYDGSDALDRLEEAKARRCASVFPGRDGMMHLAGEFSLEDGMAVRQALDEAARRIKAAGDDRTLAQISADVLVERVTGKSPAEGTKLMLHMVMTDRTLFQGSSEPAHLLGYGTVPATWARIMVGGREPQDKERFRALVSLKRIYTHPDTGALVAMDSRSRQFPKALKDLISVRDQYCRTPWCNAPVREFDHVLQHSRGGPTSAANASARCRACNQTKEQAGWLEQTRDAGGRHTLEITTPIGVEYSSTAPPLPGTAIR